MNNKMNREKFDNHESAHSDKSKLFEISFKEIRSNNYKRRDTSEKENIIYDIVDDNLDAIIKELEKEELSNKFVPINNNFQNKYQRINNLSEKNNSNPYQNGNFSLKDQDNFSSNIINNNNSKSIQSQTKLNSIKVTNDIEKNETIGSKSKKLSFMKDNYIGKQDKNDDNFDRQQMSNVTNKIELKSMIDLKNIMNQNNNRDQNNLPTSYTRDKSYDFSSMNRHSLNKSFNSRLSKNVKGQETIYFQLVSNKEVGIESNFYMTPQLIQIIKDFHGYYDRNLKMWFVSFFNYLKIHEILLRTSAKENIFISIIDNLPLNFLSKIDANNFTFKPEGSKKQFTLDYSNEQVKTLLEIPPFMYSSLYNFQKVGIEFGISKNCRFLLADEMGVGKTIQAIGCTSVFQEDWPVLIICPSSLKYNWKDEILYWLKDMIKSRDAVQVIKTSSDDFKSGRKFFVISYDLCLRMEKKLQEMEFNFIIADEAHYLKSREAKRSKILLPLMQKSKRLILLSGTPIVARPSECFNLLKALRPDIFNKFLAFADRYCDPKNGPFGRDYTGSSNVKELNFILNNLMLRRLKKDVLSELPPKKRQKITINTDEKVIKQIKILLSRSNIVVPEEVEGGNFDSVNSTFPKAYTLTGQAKIEGIQEYMNYLIENDCKFLIFAHHKVVMDGIEDHVIKKKIDYMRIDGSIVNERRHECVNKFQNNDNCKIAILAITACATGLTLTKASTVVFAEIYFTPAVMIQAEDRAHRIGQEHNCVNVHYLIGKDTVDEIVFPKLEDKFTVVSNALDAKKLNMDVHNVQKGGKGEIDVGKGSKNLNMTQNNNLNIKSTVKINENVNKIDNDKSGNKTKITDFFSKKSSTVSDSDLCSSNHNGSRIYKHNNKSSNIKDGAPNSLNNFKNIKKNDSTTSIENINRITNIEEDPLDDVLEGCLKDEEFINQIFENEVLERQVNDIINVGIQVDHEENPLRYFNLHKQVNGKRTREQMDDIQNSISKKELESLNIKKHSEGDYRKLSENKQIKRK